jgi:hypothetical protein
VALAIIIIIIINNFKSIVQKFPAKFPPEKKQTFFTHSVCVSLSLSQRLSQRVKDSIRTLLRTLSRTLWHRELRTP